MVQWTLVWAGIGVLTAISGALLGWVVFPGAVHDKILEVSREGNGQAGCSVACECTANELHTGMLQEISCKDKRLMEYFPENYY